ncbi:hypothetical protein, partial [Bradyrhizobium ottawaense]|uniref:hypothetical protein n=1 Tax=Bradyrhizobium ottawaense TaxID=931866 RepID=UPI0035115694
LKGDRAAAPGSSTGWPAFRQSHIASSEMGTSSQSAFSFAGQSSRAADRSRILIPRCVLSPSDAEFLNRKPENKELRL